MPSVTPVMRPALLQGFLAPARSGTRSAASAIATRIAPTRQQHPFALKGRLETFLSARRLSPTFGTATLSRMMSTTAPSSSSSADDANRTENTVASGKVEACNDPFGPTDPQRDLQAHMISEGHADTRHFLEQKTFRMPVKSAVTAPMEGAMTQYWSEANHTLPHPIWTGDAMEAVTITHCYPEKIPDKIAYWSVKALRSCFDVFSGYALGHIDERGWLNRIVFLETVAGVPGMVGAMVRHLSSLRRMERDYGWIHTLLEEAENERMHLMTAMVLKKPTYLFRAGVLLTQGFFLSAFMLCYIASRRCAHRFVGYLEEEAVITYTKLIAEIDNGGLPLFKNLPAPPVARDYWRLDDGALFRDVVLAIRADESHHRDVNHTFAEMRVDSPNPFPPGH